MMRFVLVILAVLGVAHAANEEVEKLFKDAIGMIPKDDVIALFMNYAENDAEVKLMVQQLQNYPSPETLVELVQFIAPFKEFIRFFDKFGLNIAPFVTRILVFVHGMDNYVPNPPRVKPQRTGVGLKGFIQDFNTIVPMDEIAPMILVRKQTSTNIAVFLEAVGSTNMKDMLGDLWKVRETLQKVSQHKKKKSVTHVEL